MHVRRELRQIILNQGFFLPRSLPTCGEGIEQKITERSEMSIQRRSELISHCPSLKAKWGKSEVNSRESFVVPFEGTSKKLFVIFINLWMCACCFYDPLLGARVYKREKQVTHCRKSLNKTRYATKMPQIPQVRCAYSLLSNYA